MESDGFALPRMLHLLIRKFITMLEKHIEFANIDKNKVFIEVLKRSFNISQGLKIIASNALANEIAGKPCPEEILNDKVKSLMETYLQQDLLECALNFKSSTGKHITYRDLHDSLYWYSVKDKNYMMPFLNNTEHVLPDMLMGDLQSSYSAHSISPSENIKDLDSILLSSQFNKSRSNLEEELLQLKLTVQNESPFSQFKSTIDSKFSDDIIMSSRNTSSYGSNEVNSLHQNSPFDCVNLESFDDLFHFQNFLRDTWEGRMKQLIPCHLYSSELVEREVELNVTEDDSLNFRSLHDLTTSMSEDNMKHDVLDLLVGIPSTTFLFDITRKEFHLKPHVHISKLSHESTMQFFEKFMESGSLFKKLQSFSTELFQHEGFILTGLKNGIQQVLRVYNEYIIAVKMKKPSMLFLKTDVLEAAQSLNVLGACCRINCKENDFFELPKGLGLLSYLNDTLWTHRTQENAFMIAVIMKYAYFPYFKFLDKWMDEGICYDPYGEFQIIEDFRYLDRKDELYWKLAYTDNLEDPMRIIPAEIQSFAKDILQCGKNMRLLKICCSQLYSLDYMTKYPPPSLSMIFSNCAASVKAEKCIFYIQEKEKAELEIYRNKKETCEEDLLLDNQLFVTRKDILLLAEKRQNLAEHHNLFKLESSAKSSHVLKKCNSFEIITSSPNFYSDVIYKDLGILFSVCDYFSEEMNHSSKLDKLSHKSKDSCKQLSKYKMPDFRTRNFHYRCFQNCDFESKSENSMSSLINKSLNFSTESKVSNDILPGTFTSALASLLTDGCADTKQDVFACLQLSSLQNLMFYSFRAVLDMRMHIVKKVIMDYVMNQLKFEDLLICLKNTYLLLDESFSQLLLEKLFSWILKCHTIEDFSNWSILNEMFVNSLSEGSCSRFPILSTGSVNVVDLPETGMLERNDFLNFFQFEFQISWPLNIIIHKACIDQYMAIFSSLMKLDFLSWLLGRTWRKLMFHGKAADIQNSIQFKEIMLNRFDMHQFICILRSCIRHDLQGPVWDFLSKNLSSKELSIDALEEIHSQYLERVLTRCFLTNETQFLHELVVVMSRQIYRFCMWALDCVWEFNESSKQYEISIFDDLSSISEIYRNHQKTFYDIWIQTSKKEL